MVVITPRAGVDDWVFAYQCRAVHALTSVIAPLGYPAWLQVQIWSPKVHGHLAPVVVQVPIHRYLGGMRLHVHGIYL